MKAGLLLAAGTADWEAEAVRAWAHPRAGVALLKRCMDLPDLLSTATTGVAQVAVIDESVLGLDGDAVRTLRDLGLRVVAVAAARERYEPLGVDAVLAPGDVILGVELVAQDAPMTAVSPGSGADPSSQGTLVAVWGPAGAPGRTTVATGLASLLEDPLLLDLDPYGGSVGQHLGITDPVAGVLAASRLVNAGTLDAAGLERVAVRLSQMRVLTGLPRADRWEEVCAIDEIVERARGSAQWVVADTGFSLERDDTAMFGARQRNELTLSALGLADEVVVVGTPDAIGLARLVRGLADLADVMPQVRPTVVVNRMRSGLGWSQGEVLDAIGQVAPAAEVVVLPEDRAGADRALLAGRAMAREAGSSYRRAFAGLAQALSSRYSPATV